MRRTLEPRRPWQGARVVLGVAGGISSYKCVQLARDLTRLGAAVDVVLTHSAQRFVTPLSFEAVTGRPVLTDMFSVDGAARHVSLGREADVVCVAPATADLLARAAQGRASDLITTTLLATRAPVLLCPAMNDLMFSHPQVQANLAHVRDTLGYGIVGPDAGPLAHGEDPGAGRMVEPEEIVEWIGQALAREKRWEGMEVLVTAGPTREALDPVRYLGNRSSGRMGFALARAAWRRGARVTLVSGPSELADPPGVDVTRVTSARDMEAAVMEAVGRADVVVFAAAVSDYRPGTPESAKMKRSRLGPGTVVELTANPDVAAETRSARKEGAVAVGFALETEDLMKNARAKIETKALDLIVANPADEEGAGFESDTNRVVLLDTEGEEEELPVMSKDEIAEKILDRIALLLEQRTR